MFAKVALIAALLGCVSAQHGSYSSVSQHNVHAAPAYHAAPLIKTAHVAPIAHYAHAPVHQEVYPDAHPQYNFHYGVEDVHTGDIKSQEESRDGDAVHGSYTLVQPDGIKRIVHYTADKNGFNADVQYDGHADHPQPVHKAVVAKVVAPVYQQAPAYHSYHH